MRSVEWRQNHGNTISIMIVTNISSSILNEVYSQGHVEGEAFPIWWDQIGAIDTDALEQYPSAAYALEWYWISHKTNLVWHQWW